MTDQIPAQDWRRRCALAFAIGTLSEALEDVRLAQDAAVNGLGLEEAIAHVEQALTIMRRRMGGERGA